MNRVIKDVVLDLMRYYYIPQKLFVPACSKILVLSHMRAGSSLLTHLLLSNPSVAGYGECHVTYDNSKAFDKALAKIHLVNKEPFLSRKHRFILDKVLHNQYLPTDKLHLLDGSDSFVIFLIRKPAETIPSIMEHGDKGLTEAQAAGYYIRRLNQLADYARGLSPDKVAIALTYEQVLFHTQKTFELIQDYLQLDAELSENYNVTGVTGVMGKGDSSQNIKRGTIVRDIKHKRDFQLSDEFRDKANIAYESCSEALFAHCKSIATVNE